MLKKKKVYVSNFNAAAIIGIVFGVILSSIGLGVCLYCLYKKKSALKSSL
jgi:hypothetical protein